MRIGAKLPPDLWPETWNAAAFLHNRSPQQSSDWKTPFEKLHQWLLDEKRDTGYLQDHIKPDITFLKAYGCKAYPLTVQALNNTQKKDLKTSPHAEVGYLVGYDFTNIFRIWIPSRDEIRRVRDVKFAEDSFYDPDLSAPSDQEHSRLKVQLPAHIEDESDYEEISEDITQTPESATEVQPDDTIVVQTDEPLDHTDTDQNPYPSPAPTRDSPPDSLQLTPLSRQPAVAAPQPRRSQRPPQPRKRGAFSAFTTGRFHSSFFLGREEKLHQRSLPPEPKTWKDLKNLDQGGCRTQSANLFASQECSGVIYVPSREVRSAMLFVNNATDIACPYPDSSACRFNCCLDRVGKSPVDGMRRETHTAVVVVSTVLGIGKLPQSPPVAVLFQGLRNNFPFTSTLA